MVTFLRESLRLLYWIFFRPYSLRAEARQIDPGLDEDLKLWEAGEEGRARPEWRSMTWRLIFIYLTLPLLFTALVGGLSYLVAGEFPWVAALLSAASYALGSAAILALSIRRPDRSRRAARLAGWGIFIFGVLSLLGGILQNLLGSATIESIMIWVGGIGLIGLFGITGFALMGWLGVVLALAAGVAAIIWLPPDLATSITYGMVFGVGIGTFAGTTFGLAFGAVSSLLGVGLLGAVPGVLAGLAISLGWGVSEGMIGNLVTSLVLSVVFGLAGDIAFAVGFFGGTVLGRLRLFPYAVQLPLSLLMSRARPRTCAARLSWHPISWDETIQLRLYGLDRYLARVSKAGARTGLVAMALANRNPQQQWASRSALIRITIRDLEGYEAAAQIASAPKAFNWLPEEPHEPLQGMAEVRRRVEGIAREVEAAQESSSDYNRLRRLNQAQAAVRDWRQSFAVVEDATARSFLPVAEHWDRLLEDEVGRMLREEQIKAPIPNPYITGIPLQSDEKEMFAPRPDLVRALENALNALHGKPTLALYGPRRMGKTTVLLHLPRQLPDEVVPVFVDLQEAVQVQGLAGLFFNWADAAHRAARDHRRLRLPRPELADFEGEPAIALRKWLDGAERSLDQRKLFFTFDEFERLVDAAERNPALEGAFDILRHLSQHRPRVYLLFAGAHRMEELAPGGRWHDYFINVRGLEVSYLNEADARRLITEPIPDFPLAYAPEAVDEVVRLTRCQPMLVQLMGSILIDFLNSPARRDRGDWLTATLDDVTYAAGESLHVGRPYFANLWADAGREGRRVLAAAARTPLGLVEQDLAAGAVLSGDELSELLGRLQQYQLLEEVTGRWRVQVELTRRAFDGFARQSR